MVRLKEFSLLYIENSLDKIYDSSDFLEESFAQVFMCTTIEEVTHTLKEFFVDLIIVNLDIDNKNLIKFLQLINKNAPKMPIVGISASTAPQTIKIDLLLTPDHNIQMVVQKALDLIDQIDSFSKENRSKNQASPANQSPKIDDAINSYFTYILEGLIASDKPKRKENSMSYFLMKPFLITAINHFKAIDGTFENDSIKEARWKMDKAGELWRIMIKKTSASIETLYEEVFLKKQVEYLALLEENIELTKLMNKKRADLDIVNRELISAKDRAKPDPDLIKKLNSRNVDLVHTLAQSRDRQVVIRDSMARIYDANIEEFTQRFRDSVESIRAELSQTLGLMAYRLDRAIWQRAKSSNSIKKFFNEARINGFFSSKTFLEYFIKNLDKEKASKQQKDLAKYLDEYNNKHKILIYLLSKNEKDAQFLKHQIEQIDPLLKVQSFNTATALLNKHKSEPAYAIICDFYLLSNKTALDLVAQFKATFADESDQIFIVNLPSQEAKQEKQQVNRLGITNFIHTGISQEKLADRLIEIL